MRTNAMFPRAGKYPGVKGGSGMRDVGRKVKKEEERQEGKE